jgi:hypothetical protein
MTDNTTLQTDFDLLAERCNSKQGELATARSELSNLVGTLVDAADKERKSLLQKRVELLNLVGALDDELQVLVHRRDVANLAIFEFAESEAQEKARKFDEQCQTARLALDALVVERRILQNSGRGKMTEVEADKKRMELNIAITKMQAENEILVRDAKRAGLVLQRARNATEELRKELENGIRL